MGLVKRCRAYCLRTRQTSFCVAGQQRPDLVWPLFQIETSESILPSDTPPVVIISYLNGTLPIKQPRGLLIQGWHDPVIYRSGCSSKKSRVRTESGSSPSARFTLAWQHDKTTAYKGSDLRPLRNNANDRKNLYELLDLVEVPGIGFHDLSWFRVVNNWFHMISYKPLHSFLEEISYQSTGSTSSDLRILAA